MKHSPWKGLAAASLFVALAGAAAAAEQTVRQQFVDAYDVARSGAPAVRPDSRELTEYVLYPYLEAARLHRDLSSDGAIAAFLDRHGDEPVARALRRDWLVALADRRAWSTFADHFGANNDTSVTLRCHAASARLALGRKDGLESDVIALWKVPESAPAACDGPFDWLKTTGRLTPELIEERAQLALEQGESSLARFLARSLPARKSSSVVQWADLIDRPAQTIDALIAAPSLGVDPNALLDGWSRYARRDPQGAAERFSKLVEARGLDQRAASPFAVAVGFGLALSRLPGALDYFALTQPEDMDERAHEWHVRAALWAADWSRVASAIGSMPPELSSQNRWRYWSARAAEKRGESAEARRLYALVLPTDNWYAALTAARLGQRFAPTLQKISFDTTDVAQLADLPAMVRARELYACRLEPEATAEWRSTYDVLTPAQQRSSIRLAADWGWHLQSIATAAKQSQFNDYPLLYPRPFDTEVRAASRLTNLPDANIYAIMRQESLYRTDAGSSAGALGLMQLLPSTAQRTARRWDLKVPTRADLLQPSINVPIGAGELRNLIDRFAGQSVAAYAAYNAGPGAARRWLPEQPVETDVWVENIPFNETRAYVQRVAWHTLVFTWLQERKPVDVTAWLASVSLPATVAMDDT